MTIVFPSQVMASGVKVHTEKVTEAEENLKSKFKELRVRITEIQVQYNFITTLFQGDPGRNQGCGTDTTREDT